jgi:hypothetical protein
LSSNVIDVRKMCKEIRARFPKASIIVGVWGFTGDHEEAKASFERTPPDQIFTSFLQVGEYLHPPAPEVAEPILVGASD